MTTELILVTQQTTNLLVDTVNARQSEGYLPACGLLNFNARYTQLMARDLANPRVAQCPYFIIDGTDGSDFAEKANRVLAQIPNAACLGNVLYAASRYIQAWGDDAFHSGGGGLPWYTETDVSGLTVPEIMLANGMPFLLLDTNGNGQGGLAITENSGDINNPYFWLTAQRGHWAITGDGTNAGSLSSSKEAMLLSMNAQPGPLPHILMQNLYNGDLQEVQVNAGDSSVNVNKDGVNVRGAALSLANTDNKSVLEMDATATRFKRGTNQLLSMSDGGGAMTWNSIIRCAWNADGWNVSRDNGVAFTSRATYAAMMGPNGSRAEASNTGLTLLSSDNTTLASSLTLTNGNIAVKGGPLNPNTTETLGTVNTPWSNLYLDSYAPLTVQSSNATLAIPPETVAKMAALLPKAFQSGPSVFTMGYLYDDIIAAFGATDAQVYNLAYIENGEKVVNQSACQMMEILFARSQ